MGATLCPIVAQGGGLFSGEVAKPKEVACPGEAASSKETSSPGEGADPGIVAADLSSASEPDVIVV